MQQLRLPLSRLPISLVLTLHQGEATVAFLPHGSFSTILDIPEKGLSATFASDGFSIMEESFSYNVAYTYKDIPTMLEYLHQFDIKLEE